LVDSYPENSVLRVVSGVIAANTDLPADGALCAASTIMGAKLAQIGAHARSSNGTTATPSISTLILSHHGCDLAKGVRRFILKMMPTAELAMLPTGLNSNGLFEYLYTNFQWEYDAEAGHSDLDATTTNGTAAVFALRDDASDWIAELGSRAKSTNAASLLRDCRKGYPLERWSGTDGWRRTRPVLLGYLALEHHRTFVDLIDLVHFELGLRDALLLDARERPAIRRATYSSDGLAEATAAFTAQWERVLQGPRCYELSAEAEDLHESYWQAWYRKDPHHEGTAREHAAASLGYAVILRASAVADGRIDGNTMQQALEIVDRHLRDRLHVLRTEVATSAWERSLFVVRDYLRRYPDVSRGVVLRKTRCGNSRQLTTILEAIAEIEQGNALAAIAMRLIAAQRRRPD
jgi:hypothetical protein